MAHLSPSAIFSPSVARQQLAAAKDWNYVDSWLSTKFTPRSPPPFERNAETLKALLALIALNESADEERELLARVETRTLEDLEAIQEADAHASLLATIEQNTTREGRSALALLANLSILLNQPLPDVERMGRSIIDLQVTVANLEQASDRVSILEAHLNDELGNINNMIQELQSEAYKPPSDMTRRTIDYQRKAKSLAAKLPELRDKVSSLGAREGVPKFNIQVVKGEEEEYRNLMCIVKELELRLKSYYGLPQDIDLARLELEGMRVELQDLIRQRDTMFEGLVERESPKKTKS